MQWKHNIIFHHLHLKTLSGSHFCASVQIFFLCVFCQVLAYSVACVGVSAFSAGIIEASKAEESMNTLRTLTEESQQVRAEINCYKNHTLK